MTNREKVICGVMAVAVIGGGLHFALPSGDAKAEAAKRAAPDFTTLITTVQVGLQQGALSQREKHVLTAASNEWLHDPFRSGPIVRPSATDAATAAAAGAEGTPLPVYTGYIDTGERPTAIIDGRDYRQNEFLAGGEYRLRTISRDRVELVRRGASDPVIILLEKRQQEQEQW